MVCVQSRGFLYHGGADLAGLGLFPGPKRAPIGKVLMFPKLPFSIPAFTLFDHVFGPVYFYSYGLCMAAALGFSIYLFARDAGKYISPKVKLSYAQGFQKAFDLGVYVIVCSLLGARLFYVLENHVEFENGHWLDAFKIWQ